VPRFSDQHRNLGFACYSPTDVETYLSSVPQCEWTKRELELLCGVILAKCLQKVCQEGTGLVGLEIDKSKFKAPTEKPPLNELLESNLIRDEDADIAAIRYFEDESYTASRVQVTSMLKQYSLHPPREELRRLILQKCCVPTDPTLSLVVLLDSTFSLTNADLCYLTAELEIPYGRVGLVGRMGSPDTTFFTYFELYPDLGLSESVQIPKI